jgi:hypothetical protein
LESGDGVVDGGRRGALFEEAGVDEVGDLVGDGFGVGGPGVGVGRAGFVFDPIAIGIAGGAFGADDLDYEGPGVGGIVVGGE